MEWRGTGASTAFSSAENTSSSPSIRGTARKIYYLDSRLAGPVADWRPHLGRAQALGFDHLCIPPVFAPGPTGNVFLAADAEQAAPGFGKAVPVDKAVAVIVQMCREFGLTLLLDIVLDRVAADSAFARALPTRSASLDRDVVDPRLPSDLAHAASFSFDDAANRDVLATFWTARLRRLADAGAGGFRLIGFQQLPADLFADLRRKVASAAFLAWTPGIARDRLIGWAGLGLDGVFASTCWWDGRAPWYVEEHETLRRIAPVIAVVEAPFGERLAEHGALQSKRLLKIAAATGNGLLMPMGFEFLSRRRMDPRFVTARDLPEEATHDAGTLATEVAEANTLVDQMADTGGELRSLTGPGSRIASPPPRRKHLDLDRRRRRPGDDRGARSRDRRDRAQPKGRAPGRHARTAHRDRQHHAAGRRRSVCRQARPGRRRHGRGRHLHRRSRRGGGRAAVAGARRDRVASRTDDASRQRSLAGHDRAEPRRPLDLHHRSLPRRAGDGAPRAAAQEGCRRRLLGRDHGEKALETSGAHTAFTVRHEPALLLDVERRQAGFASWYELFRARSPTMPSATAPSPT